MTTALPVDWVARTRFIGLKLSPLAAYLVATAYNLVRMARLVAEPMAA